MLIEFSVGKIVANQHEISVRLNGEYSVSMQAQVEAIQLLGRGANVVVANTGGCKWSIKLDNQQQLEKLSQAIGIAWE
ncbi:DUF3389 domain-containing protein [Vibrio sp. MA40-2]|uniref:DUF3389 domain-containing protein n=1 Tax=Vibrio sp. MA40-2 TaxID=3391828 RepID=UPI0039A70915